MVGTILISLRELQQRPRQIVGKRRTSVLIRNHADATGFTGFLEDRFDEVLAVQAIKPRGADNEVLRAEGAHEDFACPFGAAVSVDGADEIGFFAGREIGTGEDVVSGDMQ